LLRYNINTNFNIRDEEEQGKKKGSQGVPWEKIGKLINFCPLLPK